MTTTGAPRRPARLRVGVISAGRVGAVLGAALRRAGHDVHAVSAVSDASLRRAGTLLRGVPVAPPDEVARGSQLLLLAVPDDELAGLVGGLAETRSVPRGSLVMHTSGAHGIGILQPLSDGGALPLAIHPVMTFTGAEVDLQRLAGIGFGVTSDDILRPAAETLVIEMSGEPVWVAEAERPLYHSALAFGANNLVTLVTQAADLLRAAGVDAPPRMLGPLLGAALDNALRHGDAALTGPVARGDAGTVRTHVATLRAAAPDAVAAYVELSRLTADRALAAGLLDTNRAAALLDVLASAGRR